MSPLRMIVRNSEAYFGEGNVAYEEKYWATADALGLKMSGEAVPIYMELANNKNTTYKIIISATATDEEKKAAAYLQDCVFKKTGATLPICTENAVYPGHFEHAIMLGKNLITKEFYKQGIDLTNRSYYVEILGWCVFVDSDTDLVGAVQAFLDLCVRQGDNEGALEIISCKRVGQR